MPDRHDRLHRPEPDDNRTWAQRDRDRILYTTQFQRLAGVTQVVPAAEGHRFHNRLTHTLKVAQVARRLAETLTDDEDSRALCDEYGGVDPDVVEAAALAHDLGHPPFGHVGEQTLDRLLRDTHSFPDGFEGNPQSFRIVTKLALRHRDLPGLNLTRATLNAILKYPWYRATEGYHERKWGAYHSETEDFEFARELGPDTETPCIEAQIMDWADDIAYAVHDVEDFFRAALIPLDRLRTSADELERFTEWVARKWEPRADVDLDQVELREILDDLLRTFPITRPYEGTHHERIAIRNFTSLLIGRYVSASNLTEDAGLRPEPFARNEIYILKELTWYYVIDQRPLASQQHGQERILCELFEILADAFTSHRTALLPNPFREYVEQVPPDDERGRIRVVADCIGSFTEEEAIAFHGRLTGRRLGSVTDTMT